MQKWEYLFLNSGPDDNNDKIVFSLSGTPVNISDPPKNIYAYLQELGNQGWELVSEFLIEEITTHSTRIIYTNVFNEVKLDGEKMTIGEYLTVLSLVNGSLKDF